jgi:hypothetical protein
MKREQVNRPNILYIHSHDTGRYIQPYGHAVPTPNLQRLAAGRLVPAESLCSTNLFAEPRWLTHWSVRPQQRDVGPSSSWLFA